MNEQDSRDKKVVNSFNRMWLDSLLSLQPSGTYREAWNAVNVTDSENSFGISNEAANVLHIKTPGEIRGMIYVEDRDQFVAFINTPSGGEIGILDEKKQCYTSVTNTDIAPELGICINEWIDAEVKVVQPCNTLYLYWSSNDVYKRLNLDDPCCKFEEIPLLKPACVGTIEADIIEQGGGLPNGIYHFAAKIRDKEGNDSNWSRITNSVSISDGDHKPGERSTKAINLKIKVSPNRDYHILDMAVIRVIDGVTKIEQFDTVSVSSNSNVINHVYTGKTGRELDLLLSDILIRTNRYINGKNLIQYDDRLVLYNVKAIPNLDYQRKANNITAKYVNYIIPIEYADRFKGLRPNENYWVAIRWNYEDGTSSRDFLIPGLEGGPAPCDDYKDTSSRTQLYYDLEAIDDEFAVDRVTDHSSIELLDDETTSIPEDDLDTGGLEDEVNKAKEEAEKANQAGNNECLCEAARALKAKQSDLLENNPQQTLGEILGTIGTDLTALDDDAELSDLVNSIGDVLNAYGTFLSATDGTWDLNDDLIGAITLEQILCNCDPPESDPLIFSTDTLTRYTDEPPTSTETRHDEGKPSDSRSGKMIGTICRQEGYTTCNNNVCYTCKDGVWQTLINGDSYYTNAGYYKFKGRGDVAGLRSPISGKAGHSQLGFEYEYAEDGCTIIGIKPQRYSEGTFGAWETQNTYPETLNCDCDFIYDDLAGKNVRLHKAPSVAKEPHFISFSSGVPNKYDIVNSEFKETYMFMLGIELDNITLPENPPKPICEEVPYSVTYVERTESNKTVIGSSLGHSCFLGDTGGELYAYPKHALNSFERFDRHIEPSGPDTFRGGIPCNVGAYVLHSPDFHMRRPPLDATQCLIEREMFGKGWRHGSFALGEKPESQSQDRLNQKGTRQSINVNHYLEMGEPIVRDVVAMSKVPADSIVSKSNKFTYNLSNLDRESSVYVELEGEIESFSIDTDKYGGASSTPDGASDRSFTGDIYTDSIPIHSARGHYMTFIRDIPGQYGSPINQAYIPLGLEADGFSPKISGLVGDSFVGPMTYKRSALISDKTNRLVSKFVLTDGLAGNGIVSVIFGNLLASIFRVLGLRNGGYVPKNQDPSDHIRVFGGLRHINDEVDNGDVDHPGEINGSIGPPDPVFPNHVIEERTRTSHDINRGDNYVPQNLKTQITSYFNADVNLHYRELGNVENGEVYYSDNPYTLKGLKVDSTMPEDTPWHTGWLNRWYSEWRENAKWKLIIQGLFTFIFTYIIGIWLVIKGLSLVSTSLQAAGGGTYGLRTVGAILALSFGLMVIAFGIAWIKHWVNSDADNKLIEEYVGLKNIRPDRRNVDGSFSFDESRLRQFEDNHWRCDNTHSMVNRWEISYGMSDPYNTCDCSDQYTNDLYYSNKQLPGSDIDAWRNFKPNNGLEIPTEHGQVQKMFKLGNTLYAHTTDMLMKLHSRGGKSFNSSDTVLGSGDLFGGASPIYGGVVEGYGGLLDPNSAEVTAFGYIYPDREARKWFKFNGGLPEPISNIGVKHFMDENMNFRLLESFPDFKIVDLKSNLGVGYSFGVDHENERLLFTKIDYEVIDEDVILNEDGVTFSKNGKAVSLSNTEYFHNKSFTLSYSIRNKAWISFHNYTPNIYKWNRFNMYSFNDDGMWLHNTKGKFQTYYGEYFPFSVEYVVNDPERDDSFTYVSSIIGSEAYKWKIYDYINQNVTFDKTLAYNSHQATGNKVFLDSDKLTIEERSKERHDAVFLNYKKRIWTFKNISNYLIDSDDFIFDPRSKVAPRDLNKDNISDNIKNNLFYDNFFGNRLIFSIFDDVKLVLKRIETNITYDSR